MFNPKDEVEVSEPMIRWAEREPDVRAVLLTSSRAVATAPLDRFSDIDVIPAVLDVDPFFADRAWLEAFGPVLVVYGDPLEPYHGLTKSADVTQYENSLKIDFSLWPVGLLQRIIATPQLPAEFDAGYWGCISVWGQVYRVERPRNSTSRRCARPVRPQTEMHPLMADSR